MPNKFNSNTQTQPVIALDNHFVEYVKNGLMTRKAIAGVVRPIDEQLAEQIEHGLVTQAATIEAVSQLAKDGENNQGKQKAEKAQQQPIDGDELDKRLYKRIYSGETTASDHDAIWGFCENTPSVKTEPEFSPGNGTFTDLVRALISRNSKAIVLNRDSAKTALWTIKTLQSVINETNEIPADVKQELTLFGADLMGFCLDYLATAENAECHLKLAHAEQDKPF